MHPAWSIIFFTVFSGWGFGLAVALIVAAPLLSLRAIVISTTIAFILIIVGLVSSTRHLANPKNAWRSAFRFRTSWLSREALLVLIFFPLMLAWVIFYTYDQTHIIWLSSAVIIISIATVFSTAMIYASLKPIRLWHHPLTPINYLLLSALSGLWLLAIIIAIDNNGLPRPIVVSFAVVLLLVIIGKYQHFRRVTRVGQVPNASSATGLKAANVRLLDTGHSAPNFLTREFVYQAQTQKVNLALRFWLWGGVIIPALVMLLAWWFPKGWVLLLPITLPFVMGLLAERWLFFVQAKHVVRLYYGDQQA